MQEKKVKLNITKYQRKIRKFNKQYQIVIKMTKQKKGGNVRNIKEKNFNFLIRDSQQQSHKIIKQYTMTYKKNIISQLPRTQHIYLVGMERKSKATTSYKYKEVIDEMK